MIDKQVTDTLLHAEKYCRKLRTGDVEYLPEVNEVAERWYAWRIALKVSKGNFRYKKELMHLVTK